MAHSPLWVTCIRRGMHGSNYQKVLQWWEQWAFLWICCKTTVGSLGNSRWNTVRWQIDIIFCYQFFVRGEVLRWMTASQPIMKRIFCWLCLRWPDLVVIWLKKNKPSPKSPSIGGTNYSQMGCLFCFNHISFFVCALNGSPTRWACRSHSLTVVHVA